MIIFRKEIRIIIIITPKIGVVFYKHIISEKIILIILISFLRQLAYAELKIRLIREIGLRRAEGSWLKNILFLIKLF